jgi:hypothetical protein
MAHMLSSLHDYLNATADILRKPLRSVAEDEIITDISFGARQPQLPEAALLRLEMLVEAAPDDVSDHCSVLSSLLQIAHARFSIIEQARDHGEVHRLVIPENVRSCLVDAAIVYAHVAALYDVARRKKEAPESVTWQKVREAMPQLSMWPQDFPDILARINEYETAGETVTL